jgi:hypothetical protein
MQLLELHIKFIAFDLKIAEAASKKTDPNNKHYEHKYDVLEQEKLGIILFKFVPL